MKKQLCIAICIISFILTSYANENLLISQDFVLINNSISNELDLSNKEALNISINIGEEYYVIGIFHCSDVIVCTDRNGYQAVCFGKAPFDNQDIERSKNIETLIENGWAVCLCNFWLQVSNALSNDYIKEMKNIYLMNPPIPTVKREVKKLNTNLSLGHFQTQPEAYLLILIRGDYLCELITKDCIDCDTPPLKLSPAKSYYPLVLPLLKKNQ